MRFRPIISRLRNIAGRIGLGEAAVILTLLAIVVCAWGFIELADEVIEGETHAIDAWAIRSMRQADDHSVPVGPDWLSSAARDITGLGSVAVLVLAIFTSAGYLWLVGRPHLAWLVLGATISGQLLSTTMKAWFARERPDIVPHAVDVSTASFPSGHALMSAVVYLTLGALLMRAIARRRARYFILGVAVMLTALVGISRIYLGVHYPTDVLAGWTAGLIWALLWWLLTRYLQRKHTIEPQPEAPG